MNALRMLKLFDIKTMHETFLSVLKLLVKCDKIGKL